MANMAYQKRDHFYDHKPDINFIVHKILEQLQLHFATAHPKLKRRITRKARVFYFPVGFFDGASTNMIGGIGVHLLISQDHFFA